MTAAERAAGDAEFERLTREAIRAGRLRGVDDRCDRCGSICLVRVHGCWRCEACHWKSDCQGW